MRSVKKAGFTLIELLAIIVVITIIALIIVPIISNTLRNMEKHAFEVSVDGLTRAVRSSCLENPLIPFGQIGEIVIQNHEVVVTAIDFDFHYEGRLPKDGVIYIDDNCEVAVAVADLDWCVVRDFGKQRFDTSDIAELEECNVDFEFVGEVYTVTYNPGTGGTVMPLTRNVRAGMSSLAPTVVPEPGYNLSGFSIEGASVDPIEEILNNVGTGRSGSIQTWVVPTTGTYTLTAYGAQGGVGARSGIGGLGAMMSGDFLLEEGQTLNIIVGHKGQDSAGNQPGGGGASAIWINGESEPLLVAGGGGGYGVGTTTTHQEVAHATTEMNGKAGVGGNSWGAGGTAGDGGERANNGRGSGGGGWLTNGENGSAAGSGGQAISAGALGGDGGADGGDGGYGGGAGTDGSTGWGAASGGGGYSGGGGGYSSGNDDEAAGGGGGSFNSGSNQNNEGGVREGHGSVIISADGQQPGFDSATGLLANVTADVTINVHFTINEYTITYTSTAGGAVTPESRTVAYGGTSAAPNPVPDPDYILLEYTVVSGTGNGTLDPNSGAVTNVTGPMTIRANFVEDIQFFEITYTSTAGGTVNPSFRNVPEDGTSAAPSVNPNTGYELVNFTVTTGLGNGDLNASTGEVTNVTGPMTIRANFSIINYTVSYTSTAGGSVSPSSRTVAHGGTSSAPTATPSGGYELVNFTITSGAGNGSLNSGTGAVTNVTGNMTVRANFALESYTVTYTSSSGGSVSPGSRSVQHGGTSAAPSPTPDTGYELVNYTITAGAGNGSLNSSTGAVTNVTGPMTVRANFTIKTYTVTYTSSSGGSVSPGTQTINHGSATSAPSVTPSANYELTGFEATVNPGNGSLNTSTGVVSNVVGNMTVRANFALQSYTVTYTSSSGGSVSPGSRSVQHGGTSAAPSPTADTGYHLVNYTITAGAGNGSLNSSTGAVTNVTGDMTVRANFVINQYTITYTSSSGGGVSPNSQTVNHGAASDAPSVTPDAGHHLVNFEVTVNPGNGSLNTSTGVVSNVTGNMTVRANFAEVTYTITYTSSAGGSVNPETMQVGEGGTSGTPTANPSTGYEFVNYTITSGGGNGSLNSSTGVVSNVTGDMTIRANFTIIQYTVTYTSSSGGGVSPGAQTINHGSATDAPSVTPDAGYQLVNFEATVNPGNGSLNTSTGVVSNVTGNMTVRANFSTISYTITYQAGTGGSVEPGTMSVGHNGTSGTPSANPSTGYTFANYTVVSGGGNGSLNSSTGVVSNVTGDMTIQANFTVVQYTVTYTSSSGGGVSPSSQTVNHGSANDAPSATPDAGHSLTSYEITSGSCAGTFTPATGICNNVQGNITIRANFTINQYTVTYTASTGGSVNPNSQTVNWGAANTGTTPSANSGYAFSDYEITSGSCAGTFTSSTGICSNIQGNITIRANFALQQYTVTYTSSAGGSVSPGSESVTWGTANTGTVPSANTGYTFTNYEITSGSCAGTFTISTGICSNVQGNITIRANFTPNTYTVTYTASTGGSVNPTSRTVSHGGTSSAPSAPADTGYKFVDFEATENPGNGSLNTTTGEVTNVIGNITVRANFEQDLSFTFEPTGTIQNWQVPTTGTYRITAYGAGFNETANQRGAVIAGDFTLNQGETIQILVGETGDDANAGSGGTFVIRTPYNTNGSILVIAGGAGGYRSTDNAAMQGQSGTSGASASSAGGTNGDGGGGVANYGGGGGFFTNGSPSGAQGGFAFVNGGAGGTGSNSSGGFGGGAGRNHNNGTGGGGGYSGGGGGDRLYGGGGGSYNNGANQSNTAGAHSGHGFVEIEFISP